MTSIFNKATIIFPGETFLSPSGFPGETKIWGIIFPGETFFGGFNAKNLGKQIPTTKSDNHLSKDRGLLNQSVLISYTKRSICLRLPLFIATRDLMASGRQVIARRSWVI